MTDEILWAIKINDMASLQNQVEEQGWDINKEMNGRLPLHYAADYGHTGVIEYLLNKGADINKTDKYGITPLLAAVFEGHLECVKLLLKRGADKNGKSPSGESYAECAETDEIKRLLL